MHTYVIGTKSGLHFIVTVFYMGRAALVEVSPKTLTLKDGPNGLSITPEDDAEILTLVAALGAQPWWSEPTWTVDAHGVSRVVRVRGGA